MRNQPLILSPAFDIHAAAAVWGMRKTGAEPVWSKSASLAEKDIGGMSLHIDRESDWKAKGGLDPARTSSVWFRRARDPLHFPDALPCDAAFLRDEWMLYQRNVYALCDDLSDALWINRPDSARFAENKLVQLRAARRCGLHFPATLVSNDPEEVVRFRQRHPCVIYKPFSLHTWVDGAKQNGYIAHARILQRDAVIDDASVTLCPGIYQAYVDKVCDLRVTVIGDRHFAVRLASSAGDAFVDWRSHVRGEDFQAQLCDIPDSCWRKLKALMADLGIVFGCIDLVLDKAGELHFLEVNQSGQFLFVEGWQKSLPLLQAMCAMMIEGRADYSLPIADNVSYQAFRDSDAYLAWAEEANCYVPSDDELSACLTVE